MRLAPRASRAVLGARAAVVAVTGMIVAIAADSPMKITAKPRGSHANLAGRVENCAVAVAVLSLSGERLFKETSVPTTFQKRQKEMKRMEKARMKAERRAQKKLEPRNNEEDELKVLTGPAPLEDDPLADPSDWGPSGA